jgi:hypothetical protein
VADTIDTIIAAARADVAAGREPDEASLETRIRKAPADEAARRRALDQLHRIVAVHRARSRVAAPAAAPPPPAPAPRRAAYRAKATIGANFELRREGEGETAALAWDRAPVAGWEVRISERRDARSDYVVRETTSLPGDATRLDLPLGELPLRVHLLGRGRDGRLVRRAMISGVTRDNWRDRWQKRASAS